MNLLELNVFQYIFLLILFRGFVAAALDILKLSGFFIKFNHKCTLCAEQIFLEEDFTSGGMYPVHLKCYERKIYNQALEDIKPLIQKRVNKIADNLPDEDNHNLNKSSVEGNIRNIALLLNEIDIEKLKKSEGEK